MCNLDNFLNRDFLFKKISNCRRLNEIEDCNGYIKAYDEQLGTYLHFHYNPNFDDIFDFGSTKVDKNKFFKILKNSLEEILFLMPQKIYFISTSEELERLLDVEEYSCQHMDYENNLGINWTLNSTIVININLCRAVAKEASEINGDNIEEIFNECVWTTLIHELRHMVCNLGFIIPESLISISEDKEENVERYANDCFWDSIVHKEDYICFNLSSSINKE